MKMWRATVPTEVDQVEVKSATERYVYCLNKHEWGRDIKMKRVGKTVAYFENYSDVLYWLIDQAEAKITACRREIDKQEDILAAIHNGPAIKKGDVCIE